jgi:glyoxylase-like metal-dependent hydrolase (beta-lactamase superfamily II)
MQATEIAFGVWRLPTGISNAYFVRPPGARWVLIDSGPPGNAKRIRQAAEELFGPNAAPEAIILTHGHFDHAGSSRDLAEFWSVPVFAHALERPYLTGASAYPPYDPTIGGAMAFLSRFFPSTTTNVGPHLYDLRAGEVPELPEWSWLHTPGHAPGHVSFYNRKLSVLLSGDAVASVDTDSWIAMTTQVRRISRPPAPFTIDWMEARRSVELLARLAPFTIGCGHGTPMSGVEVAQQLTQLARDFPCPVEGRYARRPARTDERGIVTLPPAPPDLLMRNALLAAGGLAAGSALGWLAMRTERQRARTAGGD